jgi:hypothetical protein
VTPGNAQIFLKSANQPSLSVFQSAYTVSTQLGASSWNLGQTLTITFPSTTLPLSGGNITIYIVSQSTLLFSVILPGTSFIAPPTVVSTYITPTAPVVGQSFTVYAAISGSYKSNSVYVNLAAVPGASTTPQVMTQNAQGLWYYTLSSGASKNGTYFAFVNVTGSTSVAGQTAVGTVIVTISSVGTSNGPLSVGVVLVPAPPNSAVAESVQAVVTYTGPALSSPAAVSVTFSASSSPSGYTYSGTGASGVTISGPSGPASVTVASQTTWTIPNPTTLTLYTYTVSATATVTGVGSITGTTTFTPSSIVVGPTSGLVGSTFTVWGAGYVKSTNINVTLGGITLPVSGTGSNATCIYSGSTITSTSTGTFACRFVVPNGAPSGATTVAAADSNTGQNDSAAFTVTPWSIFPSPQSGLMNSTVTIRGAGFVGSTTVTLSFNGYSVVMGASCSSGTTSGSTVTVLANGSFVACTFPVPNTASPGSNTIKATDSAGQVATYTYTVTTWTLTVSPSWVSIKSSTTSVTLTGAGFAAGSKVTIVYNGSMLTSGTLSFTCTTGGLSGATITPSSGAFVCTLTLTRDPPGIYTFTATDYPSGQVATASVGRS